MASSRTATKRSQKTKFVQMSFKVSEDFKVKLEALAAIDNRSMTGELQAVFQPILEARAAEIKRFIDSLNEEEVQSTKYA